MWRRSDIALAVFLGLAMYVAWELRRALLLLYISIILAIVLTPAVDWLRKWRIGQWRPGRAAGVFVFMLLASAAAALVALFALPALALQAKLLMQQWPERLNELLARIHGMSFAADVNASQVEESVRNSLTEVLQTVNGVTGALIAAATFIVLTAYFIVDGRRVFRWFVSLWSPRHADRLTATLASAEERVSRWIFGQLLLMLILATADLIVYGALGINYFYVLAVFAGAMNFIPIIGPLIGLVPAAIVAATQSVTKLIAVLAFYAIYQQIDNSYITPRVMRATVDISPLAVIISLIIGAELAGIPGAFIAVPSAALIEVLVREYLVRGPARV
jgi:predicted PurR-regulated permease PerM